MSWQAFTWTEIQTKAPRLPDRLVPTAFWTNAVEILSFTAEFLGPFAVMEFALGMWRLGADMGWTGAFFVDQGILSHWQVWLAMSAFTQFTSIYLRGLLRRQPESVEKQS
jgi:hypothetical protein